EYGDDGILTVQITDPFAGRKKRFAIQQSGQDQLNATQVMHMKRINEDLLKKGSELESSQEYRDALEVLKKTEQDVIPRVENAAELGQAVWAYLEVLEVDPDNAAARRQVGQVATAVRQFDKTAPGRRWALGLPWRRRGEGTGSGLAVWVKLILIIVALMLAFGF